MNDPTDIVYFHTLNEAVKAGYDRGSIYRNIKRDPNYSHHKNRIWYEWKKEG